MKMILAVIFSLVSLILSPNHSDLESIYEVRILFNNDVNRPLGIPMNYHKKELNFCIKDNATHYEGEDGVYFIFDKILDTLQLEITGDSIRGFGQFYLPEQKGRTFGCLYDPVTYECNVVIKEYFVPVRIGNWYIATNSDTIERFYRFPEFLVTNRCKD